MITILTDIAGHQNATDKWLHSHKNHLSAIPTETKKLNLLLDSHFIVQSFLTIN